MIRTGLGLKAKAKRVFLALTPAPLAAMLWHAVRRGAPRTELPTAQDHETIAVQPGARLEVYWSDVPGVGWGPSASLYVRDEEVLRLDCFGNGRGHMHLNPVQHELFEGPPARLWFPDLPIPDQIARGAFELSRNADAACRSNLLRRVRRFALDQAALDRAADAMARRMTALYAKWGDDPKAEGRL